MLKTHFYKQYHNKSSYLSPNPFFFFVDVDVVVRLLFLLFVCLLLLSIWFVAVVSLFAVVVVCLLLFVCLFVVVCLFAVVVGCLFVVVALHYSIHMLYYERVVETNGKFMFVTGTEVMRPVTYMWASPEDHFGLLGTDFRVKCIFAGKYVHWAEGREPLGSLFILVLFNCVHSF